jgi:methylase of polypeptide subunit release factors
MRVIAIDLSKPACECARDTCEGCSVRFKHLLIVAVLSSAACAPAKQSADLVLHGRMTGPPMSI